MHVTETPKGGSAQGHLFIGSKDCGEDAAIWSWHTLGDGYACPGFICINLLLPLLST